MQVKNPVRIKVIEVDVLVCVAIYFTLSKWKMAIEQASPHRSNLCKEKYKYTYCKNLMKTMFTGV